jgi:hypothetical protein
MMILAKAILLAVEAPLFLDDARGIVEIFVEYYSVTIRLHHVLLVR